MTVVGLILAVALMGAVVWLVLQIPMPEIFKNVILVVVAIILILWVLQALGVSTGLPHLRLW